MATEWSKLFMMKIFKKTALLASVLLIIFSLFSCSWGDVTVAPDGTPVENPEDTSTKKDETFTSSGTYGLTYDDGGDFYVVTGYHGTQEDVFIPATWGGKPVTGINSYAFYYNDTVKTITITSAIKTVKSHAIVGDYKVYCETDTPHECDTEGCTSIHPTGWNKDWYKNDNGSTDNVEWGFGGFSFFYWEANGEDITITGYIGNPFTFTIPEKIGSKTVVAIKDEAFRGCSSLESIVLPDSIKEIGYSAFRECTSLKSIILPESVTVIPEYLFEGCTSLESVTISSSTKEIKTYAFANCTSLENIYIPNTVENMANYVFQNDRALTIYLLDFEIQKIPSAWKDNWNHDGSNGEIPFEFTTSSDAT